MKFCPECGSDLNENGICNYCGYPNMKEEFKNPVVIPNGMMDPNPTPRLGAAYNEEYDRRMERDRIIYEDIKSKRDNNEITTEQMKEILEKLGFVNKE